MFLVTEAWKTAYPQAHVGILVMQGVHNPPVHAELEALKRELENRLRARFAGQERKALETDTAISAYASYYKRFDKTYHVQAQLESVLFKARPIPSVAALVEAMFMAEIKNAILTAGHDLDQLKPPITLDIATGNEQYTLLRGQPQETKAGDMLMADQLGVISSILYGPDQRTQITAQTRQVLFAVYAPAGISPSHIHAHLEDIQKYVLVVSPAASVQALQILGAGTP